MKQKSAKILKVLKSTFPDAHCELNYNNPFELLIATILSAQCTDVMVNKVTPLLFEGYPTPLLLGKADIGQIEQIVRPTGFYKNKAKNIVGCALKLQEEHNGQVPQEMDQLIALPGVGRKTANVVLGNAFNINLGVVVDTHVKRISRLLRLTAQEDPVKIEQDLMKLFPKKDWTLLSHLLIWHGRRTCIARRPQCDRCKLFSLCPGRKA